MDSKLTVKIDGEDAGLSRRDVNGGDLGQYLCDIEGVLESHADDMGLDSADLGVLFHVESVTDGSVKVHVGLQESVEESFPAMLDRADQGDFGGNSWDTTGKLRKFKKDVAQNGHRLEVRNGSEYPLATIDANFHVPEEPEPEEIRGGTTVYGVVARINKDNRDAGLELLNGQNLKLSDVGKEHRKVLGELMEECVVVRGEGVWDADDEKLKYVVPGEIEKHESDFIGAFEGLADEMDAVDDVEDAPDYVRGQRGRESS